MQKLKKIVNIPLGIKHSKKRKLNKHINYLIAKIKEYDNLKANPIIYSSESKAYFLSYILDKNKCDFKIANRAIFRFNKNTFISDLIKKSLSGYNEFDIALSASRATREFDISKIKDVFFIII